MMKEIKKEKWIQDYKPRKNEERRYIAHDSIPHLCHIELTYACNQNCIFCYNPSRKRNEDIEVVDQIVKQVAQDKIPHVYLIGGEPSLLSAKKLNSYIEILSDSSSVTIVTNGLRTLKGISQKIACFGVPLHGDKETHEFLNQTSGSYEKTRESIKYYVEKGYDVRCISVLSGYNYDQMYELIELADKLGMESVYVDRYEDGGIGSIHSKERNLKPTEEQFKEAVGQIIQAKKDFLQGRVGFGTAIPYCLDERIIEEGLTSNCGVGSYFAAINPEGNFRLCNQSQLIFGNVLEETIQEIWNKEQLDIFRDLHWLEEPCNSCSLVLDCVAGCKVDANCSDSFCVDYAVRKKDFPPNDLVQKFESKEMLKPPPEQMRRFSVNRYLKLTTCYEENFMVTRYQTVKLDREALEIIEEIIRKEICSEKELISRFDFKIPEKEIRRLVTKMIQAGALDEMGGKEQ